MIKTRKEGIRLIHTQDQVYVWKSELFIKHLQIFGFSLIAVSILYLVAANWFMLSQPIQLAIPQILLLLSAIASILITKHDFLVQCLHTICGLMIGLSLAVIGQIYQTGADSYLLFLIWSILLLPWFYRYNIGVFLLFCVISQIALFLFFIQTFWGNEYPELFMICVNLFALIQFYFCIKYYPKLRYLFLLWFAIFSIWHMAMYLYAEKGWIYLVFAFPLLASALSYFYKNKDQLGSALAAVSLGITFTFLLVEWTTTLLGLSDFLELLFIGLIIFAWFALITSLLIKFNPQSRFNSIPLAVGAWMTGVVFASLMLTFWGNFSLIMGLVFILITVFLLKNKQSLFLRQFAYCMLVAGQIAVIFHTVELTEQIFPILFLQFGILVLSYFLRTHWFFIFIQILGLYAAGVAFIWDISEYQRWENIIENFTFLILWNYIFFVVMIWIKNIQPSEYQRSLMLSILCIILFSICFYTLLGAVEESQIVQIPILVFGLPALWFILFIFLSIQNQFNVMAKITLAIFAIVLIYYGYFEIFIFLAVISWALIQKDKVIYAFALVTFTMILWLLYYALDVTFLLKSFSIFISGIMLLLLTFCLIKFKNKEVLTQ